MNNRNGNSAPGKGRGWLWGGGAVVLALVLVVGIAGRGNAPEVQVVKVSRDKLNAAIKGYLHDDATRKSVLGANGLPDDASACKDAVNLNNLDDWKEFHDAVLK